MYYSLSDEQRALTAAVRDLLEAHADPRAEYPDPGSAEKPDHASPGELWSQLGDMGLAALLVPEDRGGSGAGPVELVLVAEELGRAVAAAPFLGTSVATAALLTEGVDPVVANELLDRVAGGIPAALLTDAPAVRAEEVAGGWVLDGAAGVVIDAVPGGDLLVGASTPDGTALFHTTGGEVVPQVLVDRCRRAGEVRFAGTAARLAAAGRAAEAALTRGRAVACLVLAADSAGVAAAVLDRTAEYARTRRQFGLPIGTFQAVKHRLADALVLAENARSATWGGAWALAEGWSSAELMVAMAKARSTANAVAVAGTGVQLHGGIAITWEHDMHLFLRRAKANEHLFGEPAEHLEVIAAALLRRAA